MDNQNFTRSIVVDQTPEEVFNSINNVRGWWSGVIEGVTDKLGAEFTYKYKDLHYSTQKITELMPGKKIVWHVEKATMTFLKNKEEWVGTDIVFEISQKDGKTEVVFTHVGLNSQIECYNACSNAWSSLISNNLKNLIITGEAQPDAIQ